MAIELDIVGGLVTAGIGGGFAGFGWMANKIWSGYRHEINEMKSATTIVVHNLHEHVEADRVLHQQILRDVGFIRGWIEGQQESKE